MNVEALRSDRALYALDRATRAIAGELEPDRVLQLIVDSVRELVGAHYAALGTFDARGRIERFITSGISPETRGLIGPLPQGHGLLGTIIRDGATLRIPDISRHPESFGFPAHHPPMRSLLGVPIRVGRTIVGNFYLTEKEGAAAFGEDDQELVEMFAGHAGIAIQTARLHQEVQDLAVVGERLRISRDLHDGIIQSIYAVSLSLEDAVEGIESDPAGAADRVDRAIDRLHTTISDIRTFIVGLGPGIGSGLAEVLEGMARELAEEVVVNANHLTNIVGLINDDETPVGRVHLGVVHIAQLKEPRVEPREADILEARFTPATELLARLDEFESWSQIAVRALFG